ncbi:MAG: helix-turn-helix domain-containing protein [Woeseia sp.]|nr:helix-turn-helix domain-containing protein [Woeseia sp.]
MMNQTDALKEAIERAGGQAALAEKLGVKQQNVNNWVRRGNGVPDRYVLAVERVTGIPCHQLCPEWPQYFERQSPIQ